VSDSKKWICSSKCESPKQLDVEKAKSPVDKINYLVKQKNVQKSRGQEMLGRSCSTKIATYDSVGPVQFALSMKIPVHEPSFILAAIDAKKLNSNSLPRNDIYIKVEDTLGKYAPQYANFESLPDLFGVNKVLKAKRSCSPVKCEVCEILYFNLDDHIHSAQHISLAQSNERFRGLDEVMASIPSLSELFKQQCNKVVNLPSNASSPETIEAHIDTSRTSDYPINSLEGLNSFVETIFNMPSNDISATKNSLAINKVDTVSNDTGTTESVASTLEDTGQLNVSHQDNISSQIKVVIEMSCDIDEIDASKVDNIRQLIVSQGEYSSPAVDISNQVALVGVCSEIESTVCTSSEDFSFAENSLAVNKLVTSSNVDKPVESPVNEIRPFTVSQPDDLRVDILLDMSTAQVQSDVREITKISSEDNNHSLNSLSAEEFNVTSLNALLSRRKVFDTFNSLNR